MRILFNRAMGLWAVFFTLVLASSNVFADPPARVGRVSYLDGVITFRADREDPGNPANMNWPVSSGAIFDTGKNSRLEISIASTAIRLGRESRLEFAVVDDQRIFLQLAVGSLLLTVKDQWQADSLEIRTPEGRVRLGRPGYFRIDVDSGRTTVSTRAGLAYLYGGNRSFGVPEGRSAIVDGRYDGLYDGVSANSFEAWARERDAAVDVSGIERYVSPEMTGYDDLNRYGTWDERTEYGVAWFPRQVTAGWAPYRFGHWAWVRPWGWTWIDDMPWGFAPFHYGRWALISGRWAWIPGSRQVRPVFAPALVAWIGGDNWNHDFPHGRAPAVGWFPLAPREVYVPPYQHTGPYLHQINTPHVQSPVMVDKVLADQGNRHFSHQELPSAVTVAPLRQIGLGRPVVGGAAPPDRQWTGLPASTHVPEGLRPQGADNRWFRSDTANSSTQFPASVKPLPPIHNMGGDVNGGPSREVMTIPKAEFPRPSRNDNVSNRDAYPFAPADSGPRSITREPNNGFEAIKPGRVESGAVQIQTPKPSATFPPRGGGDIGSMPIEIKQRPLPRESSDRQFAPQSSSPIPGSGAPAFPNGGRDNWRREASGAVENGRVEGRARPSFQVDKPAMPKNSDTERSFPRPGGRVLGN